MLANQERERKGALCERLTTTSSVLGLESLEISLVLHYFHKGHFIGGVVEEEGGKCRKRKRSPFSFFEWATHLEHSSKNCAQSLSPH